MSRIPVMIVTLLCAGSAAAVDGAPRGVIDWSSWDTLLRDHVTEGRVDYDAIGNDPGFETTVERIATADLVGHDRTDLLAFYINAYNVLAVKGILDGRSPRSALGKLRFFYRDRYTVAGELLSLHRLENDRIRPLGEPRIHFAIVCASASCPPLRSEAYAVHSLDLQLDDNARRFLNDTGKNRVDLDAGVVHLSKIFKWFREDFEAAAGDVQSYIAEFIDDEQAARELRDGTLDVRYLDYDWSLNGTSRSESSQDRHPRT
jgi:hypothetical protein